MLEDKKNIQVTLYVSKIAKPVAYERGCKTGDCHRLTINENLARATTNLRNGFYSTETQKVITYTEKYCEKHGFPLEIKDISGIVKGIRYLFKKRIWKTPALEIAFQKEKFKFNPSYPIDSIKFTEFLNRVILNQA
jgi:hypothetical protein